MCKMFLELKKQVFTSYAFLGVHFHLEMTEYFCYNKISEMHQEGNIYIINIIEQIEQIFKYYKFEY